MFVTSSSMKPQQSARGSAAITAHYLCCFFYRSWAPLYFFHPVGGSTATTVLCKRWSSKGTAPLECRAGHTTIRLLFRISVELSCQSWDKRNTTVWGFLCVGEETTSVRSSPHLAYLPQGFSSLIFSPLAQ